VPVRGRGAGRAPEAAVGGARFRLLRARSSIAAGIAATVALGVPAIAGAVVATITSPVDPTAVASCPGTAQAPCTVVSRTTAFQVEVGGTSHPMKVRVQGRIVGWKITLSSPTLAQIKFFDSTEGGTARAAIAVIRNTTGLGYRLVAMSPFEHLQPYFGRRVTFALASTIPVVPGDEIALAVPTWAPALELRAGQRTSWRASRAPTQCTSVATQTVQTVPGAVAQYGCLYRTALVSFGAVEISTP
jgi:hypothetical protein